MRCPRVLARNFEGLGSCLRGEQNEAEQRPRVMAAGLAERCFGAGDMAALGALEVLGAGHVVCAARASEAATRAIPEQRQQQHDRSGGEDVPDGDLKPRRKLEVAHEFSVSSARTSSHPQHTPDATSFLVLHRVLAMLQRAASENHTARLKNKKTPGSSPGVARARRTPLSLFSIPVR